MLQLVQISNGNVSKLAEKLSEKYIDKMKQEKFLNIINKYKNATRQDAIPSIDLLCDNDIIEHEFDPAEKLRCARCFDIPTDAVDANCRHVFCRSCLQYAKRICLVCKTPIKLKLIEYHTQIINYLIRKLIPVQALNNYTPPLTIIDGELEQSFKERVFSRKREEKNKDGMHMAMSMLDHISSVLKTPLSFDDKNTSVLLIENIITFKITYIPESKTLHLSTILLENASKFLDASGQTVFPQILFHLLFLKGR